jgi:hypothetical protein
MLAFSHLYQHDAVALLVLPAQGLAGVVQQLVYLGGKDYIPPVQQTLLSVTAGSHDVGDSRGAPTSEPVSSVTDLVIHLLMKLWELLGDDSIIGTSERPAAWLPTVRTYLEASLQCMSAMLRAVESAMLKVHGVGTTPAGEPQKGAGAMSDPASTQRTQVPDAFAQHLAALQTRVSWAQVKAAIPTNPRLQGLCSSESWLSWEGLMCGIRWDNHSTT